MTQVTNTAQMTSSATHNMEYVTQCKADVCVARVTYTMEPTVSTTEVTCCCSFKEVALLIFCIDMC